MLVGSVVDDQLRDHAHAHPVGLADELPEVAAGPVGRMDVKVVGNVVAVVAQRRRIERQQPQAGHSQVLQVREFLNQPGKIANPVIVRVVEGLGMQLIDDRILVPVGIAFELSAGGRALSVC